MLWRCRCVCGKVKDLPACDINNGKHQSCGCKRKEMGDAGLARGRVKALKTTVTHGATQGGKPKGSYVSWRAMMHRCYGTRAMEIKYYVSRGIIVCPEWHNYLTFAADMGEPGEAMTVDRIDNSGNYEPANCKWATKTEQGRNKNNNRMLSLGDKTQCVSAWCEELNIPFSTLMSRCLRGWDDVRVLTQPIRKSKQSYSAA